MWLIKQISPMGKALVSFMFLLFVTSLMVWVLNPVIIPVLVSLVLYVCLLPLHDWLTNLGWRRDMSALGILLLMMFVMLVPGSLVLAEFNEQAILWQSKASTAGQSLNELLTLMSAQLAQWQFHIEVDQLKANILSAMVSDEGSFLSSVSAVIMSIASSLLLVPFITFFLLRDFESLRNKSLNAVSNKYFELGWLMYFKVAKQTQGYVRAVLIQQSILAAVAAMGFWLSGFDSPVILGLIAGILGLIPYVGPALGLLPPFYLVLANHPVNYDAMYAAVLVIGVAYLVDNLLVIPMVVARFSNLHPLVALLGIIIFGNFLGILGMIAAIPILAISNIVFCQLLLSFNPKKFTTNAASFH